MLLAQFLNFYIENACLNTVNTTRHAEKCFYCTIRDISLFETDCIQHLTGALSRDTSILALSEENSSNSNILTQFYVLLKVHLGSVLVNNQPDAQFFFRIHLFQFSTCFEHPCAHHQENQLY